MEECDHKDLFDEIQCSGEITKRWYESHDDAWVVYLCAAHAQNYDEVM